MISLKVNENWPETYRFNQIQGNNMTGTRVYEGINAETGREVGKNFGQLIIGNLGPIEFLPRA